MRSLGGPRPTLRRGNVLLRANASLRIAPRTVACRSSASSSSSTSSSSGVAVQGTVAQQVPDELDADDIECVQQLIVASSKLPNQADQLWDPADRAEEKLIVLEKPTTRSVADLDYLSELLAIQQSDGPKNLGFFGTRNMGMTHQKLVEILSYAMVSTGNHIYTSGATGTNAAVIKGALRAEAPDLLTVILPQSLSRQPQESQELLAQVQNVVEMPEHDHMSLMDASRHCNREIIGKVQQVICFAFHDSRLLLETCAEAKDSKKIVTLFYLD